ncbi:protein CHLOROPLAST VESICULATION [Actinidia eriantha]|uniref:protein CHLOROPLAST VESICULATION n=1 Tax=Actinidia eriantha TaxID=165200 RepID=UPI00258EFFC3|nr:protein CHLOROPLAST VESICULATION [Actinidia eriantha]
MAISTSCCLNRSPLPPTSRPSSLPHVAWSNKERSWRSQCLLGMACVIIGLEMDHSMAIAENMQPIVESKERFNHRWSDKRACPPWRLNSLETIVPENLPRPSFHRRWESVGHPSRTAPAVKVVIGTVRVRSNCFTM